MRHRQGQLIRVRETVSKKLVAVQLLLSVRKERIVTKSNTLDIVLDQFLSSYENIQE